MSTPKDSSWYSFWGAVVDAFDKCPEAGECSACHPGVEDRIAIREAFERAITSAVEEERARAESRSPCTCDPAGCSPATCRCPNHNPAREEP